MPSDILSGSTTRYVVVNWASLLGSCSRHSQRSWLVLRFCQLALRLIRILLLISVVAFSKNWWISGYPNKNGDFLMGSVPMKRTIFEWGSDDGRSGFGEFQLFRRPILGCRDSGIQHDEMLAIPFANHHKPPQFLWYMVVSPIFGWYPQKKGAGIPRVFVVFFLDGSNDMAIIWFKWFVYYPLVTSPPFFTIWL